MNPYEITCIVRPDLDEEGTRAVVQQITGRLESVGGEIIASYAWSPGRRRLAFPIRDFGDGFYFTATFRVESPALRDIENAFKLNDNILRFLVVQATDGNIRQSQQRMQQAAAAAAAPPPQAPTAPARPVTVPQPAAEPESGATGVSEGAPAADAPASTEAETTPVGPSAATDAPAEAIAVEAVAETQADRTEAATAAPASEE